VAILAATPLSALAGLSLAGALAPLPGLIGAAFCLSGAMLLASLWHGDLARLGARLRHPGAPLPRLAPAAALADDLARAQRDGQERAEQSARQARANETILERLPDPLLVLDEAQAVKRLNAAARRYFGAPGTDATAASAAAPADLPALLRQPGARAAIARALSENRPQRAELVLPVPVERHFALQALPLDPPLADGGRVLLVVQDITAMHRTERMRADFVANASHELRTPLASLIGFIETLRGPAADDAKAQARFLGIMHEQAARMARLIDDLLSLSRIELTEHTQPTERVDLGRILRRAAESFEPRLAERRMTIAQDIAEAAPPVLGDADQLAQVFHNLIDNALKYGREGGTVRLAVQRLAAAPATAGRAGQRAGVQASIADDGPGIAREHLPRLTERFYRVDAARSRAAGGTGLGLAIVKHIVNRHRGQLAIASEEGNGTTVSLWLPEAPGEASEAGAPTS